jgi:hypothetical protein
MSDQIYVDHGAKDTSAIFVRGVCYSRFGTSDQPAIVMQGDVQAEFGDRGHLRGFDVQWHPHDLHNATAWSGMTLGGTSVGLGVRAGRKARWSGVGLGRFNGIHCGISDKRVVPTSSTLEFVALNPALRLRPTH